MIKFALKIKTRGGMIVDSLMVMGCDQAEAERKVNQIYRMCEILNCHEAPHMIKEEGCSLENAIGLIGKEAEPEFPARAETQKKNADAS
jgi:hypothetical protein